MDEIDKRIERFKEAYVSKTSIADGSQVEEVSETEEEVVQKPVDLLQQSRNARREYEPRGSRGAKPKMKLDLSAVQDGRLRHAYKKAKDDSDYYTKVGNKQYASMIKQQYMEDYFLPAIDALVKLNGMGAVQTNADLLAQIDSLALVEGSRGQGYTKAFLQSMYEPEGVVERSDGQVRDAVKQIRYLCETDQIRTAVGKANDIKRRIDSGENVADDEDYEIVQRVALYGE